MESTWNFEVYEYSGQIETGFKKSQYESDQGELLSAKAEIIETERFYIAKCDFDKTKFKQEEKEQKRQEQDFVLKMGEFHGLQLENISDDEKNEVTRIEMTDNINISVYMFDDLLFSECLDEIDMDDVFKLLAIESTQVDLDEYDGFQGVEPEEHISDFDGEISIRDDRIHIDSNKEKSEVVYGLHQAIIS